MKSVTYEKKIDTKYKRSFNAAHKLQDSQIKFEKVEKGVIPQTLFSPETFAQKPFFSEGNCVYSLPWLNPAAATSGFMAKRDLNQGNHVSVS